MNSKNWGDKADKDLFFTILSVKNIGVISGSEWTTIGNHMRALGYGFTNEGCRQHFQGLRRAQQKAEANGVLGDNPRKVDPTLNPITRRPGPGRGRPRKSVGSTSVDAQGSQSASPSSPSHPQMQLHHPPQAQPLDLEHPMQPQPPMDPTVGPAPTPMMDTAPPQAPAPPQVLPPPPPQQQQQQEQQEQQQQQQAMVLQPEGVSFEGASEEPDEHAAKRPKLEENHDPALNDEAILSALAAHTSPGVDHYNTE